MRLPRDSTELWLQSQAPSRTRARHGNPPTDFYEAWIERRVRKGLEQGTKKTPLRVAA